MDDSRLADRVALQELKARYFLYLDTKQWGEWRKLFTDDMVFYNEDTIVPGDARPMTTSGDEFVASVSQMLTGTRTAHHGHMPIITFSGDNTANGIWAMFDWVDGPNMNMQGFGHYYEQYARGVDGQWRIRELRLTRIRVDQLG
ncbi:MAG: nuclear transport factor 2 family protein [Acidimicrobiia bacterium]